MTARSFTDLVGRQLRTSGGKADSRRKLIGAVHAAARALGEEDRRAIYAEVTGKRSLTEMTPAEIGRVLDRLNKGHTRPMAHRPHQSKVRALWWTLYWLGEVERPDDAALDAFVRRQTGLAALRFVTHREAPALIEALKSWAGRAGVRWLPPTGAGDAADERIAVIDAIWLKLVERRVVHRAVPFDYLATALEQPSRDLTAWAPRELDEAIRLLGKRLRRALDKPVPEP